MKRNRTLFTVHCGHLLLLYSIIPIISILVVIDYYVLNQTLLHQYFSGTPYKWAFWTVLFGMPHIIGSIITLADKEYLKFYNKRLYVPFILIVFFTSFILGYFNNKIFIILYAFYRMYHVFMQQIGLSLMMLKEKPSLYFHYWKWLSISSAFIMYMITFGQQFIQSYTYLGYAMKDILLFVIAILVLVSIMAAYKVTSHSKEKIGIWFVWANVGMVVATYFFMLLDYTVFVILIPRIIHDITAFIIYCTHDRNRNYHCSHNIIYKLLRFTRMPTAVLCPILSVSIAYCLLEMTEYVYIVYVLAIFHYYMEGVIWKNGTIHRQNIQFV